MTSTQAVQKISEFLKTDIKDSEKFLEKSTLAGEIKSVQDTEEWIEKRLIPNTVFIDELGYSKMCINALKSLNNIAATDYGSSRRRDLGQQWADVTRGYLGELAVSVFIKKYFGMEIRLGHEIGTLSENLPSDIHSLVDPITKVARKPNILVGIKSTKLNGIWFDIPGAQFPRSDAHIFVKVATGRDHLFAYFKSISVFRDKVLRKGTEQGLITEQESDEIWNVLPSFRQIPAYITGFVMRDYPYRNLSYDGKKGRLHFTVTSWNGPIAAGDTDRIKKKERIKGDVQFEGIGKFTHDSGYLFTTGKLLWSKEDWNTLASKL
jgi:hypothetical protein